ncbi:hypothetical protein NMYAN_120050 [Nitrosomonas nitrosa]|uniref:Uncharacterized protein n=1 Tax=Nitrosomonas nitrosa TaxID=52442 RepID=A0A8H8YZJ6_9PROT|nr:hypothetical protein [Nitrosomonas nitrosa]CAE6492794.1 hypothetical protein NMYAN_120050 [Nitrosomonas nitrosa]
MSIFLATPNRSIINEWEIVFIEHFQQYLVSHTQLRYSGELPFYIQAGERALLSAAEGVTPPESLRYSQQNSY